LGDEAPPSGARSGNRRAHDDTMICRGPVQPGRQ